MEKKIWQKRIKAVSLIFIMVFVALMFRILQHQYFNNEELKVIADNQYEYKEKMGELNYMLLDYKGKDLLKYNNEYYVVIDPFNFKFNNYYTKKDELYALNIILKNYNKKYDLDSLNLENKSEKIKWNIDEVTYNKLSSIKGVKGFYVYRYLKVNRDDNWWSIENVLTNPYKNNKKGEKVEKDNNSLESTLKEKTANNEFVYSVLKKDLNGNVYKEYETNANNNVHIRTTLDKELQDKIKVILNKAPYNNYEQIGVALMESETGKIRALVQKDDSKPNVNIGVSTNHGFFPGSIFKVIVEEAGLENGKLTLNKKYRLNPNLNLRYKGHERQEFMNCEEALIQSSNDIYAQIGIDTGIKDIKELSRKQGLTDKVLNLDEEMCGIFEGSEQEIGDIELTSFGQKQRVTPIAAISISNVVINKGIYVKPYIIEGYVDENNNLKEENKTTEYRVISENTSKILKNQMIQVVTSSLGTGNQAAVKNITIGGKTGTAEREEGSNKFYDGWFSGFFNMEDKNYSMIVFVQDIGEDMGGGNTAGVIFSDIVKEIKIN